eukprot:jgi/Chlat1/6625/Chrsp482S06108
MKGGYWSQLNADILELVLERAGWRDAVAASQVCRCGTYWMTAVQAFRVGCYPIERSWDDEKSHGSPTP